MKDIFQHNKSTISGAYAQALEQARGRLILVVMFLMMGYLAISLRLIDLTLLHHVAEATPAAAKEDVRPLKKPLRGAVFDRNGALIATSLKMASLYADTTLIDNPDEAAHQLAKILPEQNVAELKQKLASGKKFIWLQRNITPKQEYAINTLGNPALGFQEEERRIYPNGRLTAHIMGYTDVDGTGIAGIEKSFNGQLAEGKEPVNLSIDLRVQHTLHRELAAAVQKFRAKHGIGMVMDVNTGEIIAMVSLPDFDPNDLASASDDAVFNRVTLGVFEMGSTFKLFTTAAALQSGLMNFATVIDAVQPIKMGRFTISDFHAKNRPLTLPEIFIYSSNIGTARMAAALGPSGLKNFFKSLGFMDTAAVEIPERGTPLYPSPWREVSTLTASYGHGVAVTPLHLMRAASGLVNGGIMPAATLLKHERKSLSLEPEGTRIISAKTSSQMRQLMELVVAAGTGDKAYVEGYPVGGKTGTAEKNSRGAYTKNLLLSSFLGVFPVQNPRYAVLAIIDEPQGTADTHGYATGGWTAAPVVAKVIEQMGPLYHITPDFTRQKLDVAREMATYLREFKEGNALASTGNDH